MSGRRLTGRRRSETVGRHFEQEVVMRRSSGALAVLIALTVWLLLPSAASAQAVVLRIGPEGGCQVGPTDIPGVAVTIPADCFVVLAPSGRATVHVRGTIRAGLGSPARTWPRCRVSSQESALAPAGLSPP